MRRKSYQDKRLKNHLHTAWETCTSKNKIKKENPAWINESTSFSSAPSPPFFFKFHSSIPGTTGGQRKLGRAKWTSEKNISADDWRMAAAAAAAPLLGPRQDKLVRR